MACLRKEQGLTLTSRNAKKRPRIIAGFLLLFFLFPCISFAHRVMVFAWVEGNTVHVESKFAGGKKVKSGDVTVYDMQGNTLIKGKTDENGDFSFKTPGKIAMRIVLQAGMGHQGEWTIPLEEIIPSTASDGSQNEQTPPLQPPALDRFKAPVGQPKAVLISPEEIEKAVDNALDRKLRPLINMVAQMRNESPSLKDILAGIGYIFGLVGVATYLSYRKRSSEEQKRTE